MSMNRKNGSWFHGIEYPLGVIIRSCSQIIRLTKPRICLSLSGKAIEQFFIYLHVLIHVSPRKPRFARHSQADLSAPCGLRHQPETTKTHIVHLRHCNQPGFNHSKSTKQQRLPAALPVGMLPTASFNEKKLVLKVL